MRGKTLSGYGMLYKGAKHWVSLTTSKIIALYWGKRRGESIIWQSPLRGVTLKAKQKTLPLQLLHYVLNCLEKLLFFK